MGEDCHPPADADRSSHVGYKTSARLLVRAFRKPSIYRGEKLGPFEGPADVCSHAGSQEALDLLGHHVRRHGDDRHVAFRAVQCSDALPCLTPSITGI